MFHLVRWTGLSAALIFSRQTGGWINVWSAEISLNWNFELILSRKSSFCTQLTKHVFSLKIIFIPYTIWQKGGHCIQKKMWSSHLKDINKLCVGLQCFTGPRFVLLELNILRFVLLELNRFKFVLFEPNRFKFVLSELNRLQVVLSVISAAWGGYFQLQTMRQRCWSLWPVSELRHSAAASCFLVLPKCLRKNQTKVELTLGDLIIREVTSISFYRLLN